MFVPAPNYRGVAPLCLESAVAVVAVSGEMRYTAWQTSPRAVHPCNTLFYLIIRGVERAAWNELSHRQGPLVISRYNGTAKPTHF